MRVQIAAAMAALTCSACANISDWYNANLNINGSRRVVTNEDAVAQVNLIQELVPLSRQSSLLPNCQAAELEDAPARVCIAQALALFYADARDQELRRDRLQGSLRKASELRCTEFLQHLNTIQATGNLIPGILTTALAGAGAIFTSASTARALAGSAGIVSGSRAEFNSTIFFQKAVPVIVKAIKQRRVQQRNAMDSKIGSSISGYPVENAIADVFIYNETCSLEAGLAALDEDVTLANEPGLDSLNRSLLKINLARTIASQGITDSRVLNPDGTGNTLVTAALSSTAVSAGGATDRSPEAAIVSAVTLSGITFDEAAKDLKAIKEASMTTVRDEAATNLDKYKSGFIDGLRKCRDRAVRFADDLSEQRAKSAIVDVSKRDAAAVDLQRAQLNSDQLQETIRTNTRLVQVMLAGNMQNVASKKKAYEQAPDKQAAADELTGAITKVKEDYSKAAPNPCP